MVEGTRAGLVRKVMTQCGRVCVKVSGYGLAQACQVLCVVANIVVSLRYFNVKL